MSITMLHRVHNTFHQAMEKALELGYIKRNPCSGTDRGQVDEKEKLFCTVEQLSAFISLAQKYEYYIPLLICAILGVRRGEALGLTWSRIEDGKVKIRAQLTQNNKSGCVSFKEKFKSKRSHRDHDLPPALANEFKKQSHSHFFD